MFEREMEFVAPKAKTGKENAIVYGIAAVIIAVVAFIFIKVAWIGGICAIMLVVPIYMNKRFTKEYSYVLTGDKLTVDIVDFKGKKTPIGKPVFLENLVICAKDSDSQYNGKLNDTYSFVIDARTSPRSTTSAFGVFDRDGEKALVRFEPTDMMIAEMKKYAADKIFI